MVSVIITTYGANVRLARAIDSVLNQTYKNVEVIIVDDNDPETEARKQTEKMMERYANNPAVCYIKHSKNKNGAAARNTGLNAAKGEYIAFLDDDDFYLPNRIKQAIEYLNINQTLSGVCQEVVRINNDYLIDLMQVEDGHILTIEDILISKEGIGSGSNIFLRKSIAVQANGFDETFHRKQDLEFMLRIVTLGQIAYLHDVQIIKDVSGIRPLSYKNNKSALLSFKKKFCKEINSLSEYQKKEYFTTQYSFLYNIALRNGNKAQIASAANDLAQYDKQFNSGKNRIRHIVSSFYSAFNRSENPFLKKMIEFLRNKKNARLDQIIKLRLGTEKYQEIVGILGIAI